MPSEWAHAAKRVAYISHIQSLVSYYTNVVLPVTSELKLVALFTRLPQCMRFKSLKLDYFTFISLFIVNIHHFISQQS